MPPVRELMTARQDTVRQQLKDAATAADRLTESTTAHSKAVEAAKSDAERVVEEAKVDAERITEQLQAQAEIDAERIKAQGARQAELLRAQLSRQLRLELGHESVRQAEELVRNYVADAAAAVGHRRSLPGRARCHGACGGRRQVPLDGEDALGQSAGAEKLSRTGSTP